MNYTLQEIDKARAWLKEHDIVTGKQYEEIHESLWVNQTELKQIITDAYVLTVEKNGDNEQEDIFFYFLDRNKRIVEVRTYIDYGFVEPQSKIDEVCAEVSIWII